MKREPLKHQAYEMIKNNIINCTYSPNTVINEELILQEISASRTPVRDALSRLEQEGLIRILPKKGILITGISIKELNMLYETRDLLEPFCLFSYGNRVPQEIYTTYYRMYSDFLKNSSIPYSFTEMDANFHRLIIEASQNSYFIRMYEMIESQISRTRVLTGNTSPERIERTIQEHLSIVRYALQNDWQSASNELRNHLARSKDSYFDYMLDHSLPFED